MLLEILGKVEQKVRGDDFEINHAFVGSADGVDCTEIVLHINVERPQFEGLVDAVYDGFFFGILALFRS